MLKKRLTIAPILVIPDPNGHFVVTTNASRDGLGDVLMQDCKVLSYQSKKLKQHEVNYTLHDLEFVVIVQALQMCQHYLLGKPFELITNHMRLRYIFTQPSMNSR